MKCFNGPKAFSKIDMKPFQDIDIFQDLYCCIIWAPRIVLDDYCLSVVPLSASIAIAIIGLTNVQL